MPEIGCGKIICTGKNWKNDAGPQILFAAVLPEKTGGDSFRNNEFILTCLLLSIYEDATSCYDTEELRFSARFGRVGEIINKIIKGTTLEGSLPLLFRVRKNRIRDP